MRQALIAVRRLSSAGEPVKKKRNKGDAAAWHTVDSTVEVLSSDSLAEPSDKVASFDMDGTLIVPASGAKFPKSRGDWTWFDPRVPTKLAQLHAEGYKIVLFSNQAGVEKKNQKVGDLTGKVSDIANKLGLPLIAFLATHNDRNRKPHDTMWRHFVQHLNGGVEPAKSFYCGDAAGREKGWNGPKSRKDFSCSDRKFAANSNVTFLTPEELFLGEKPTLKWSWVGADPRNMLQKYERPSKPTVALRKGQELVVLVGCVASGKSTIAKTIFEANGYVRANNDDHGNKNKCLKIAAEAFALGKSVVIDNTNPDASTRQEYLNVAKKFNVPHSRCVVLDVPREVCDHLNLYREYVANVRRIPAIAFNMFKSRYQKPSVKEGFNEIVEIEFGLHFDSNRERELFLKWQ